MTVRIGMIGPGGMGQAHIDRIHTVIAGRPRRRGAPTSTRCAPRRSPTGSAAPRTPTRRASSRPTRSTP